MTFKPLKIILYCPICENGLLDIPELAYLFCPKHKYRKTHKEIIDKLQNYMNIEVRTNHIIAYGKIRDIECR